EDPLASLETLGPYAQSIASANNQAGTINAFSEWQSLNLSHRCPGKESRMRACHQLLLFRLGATVRHRRHSLAHGARHSEIVNRAMRITFLCPSFCGCVQ